MDGTIVAIGIVPATMALCLVVLSVTWTVFKDIMQPGELEELQIPDVGDHTSTLVTARRSCELALNGRSVCNNSTKPVCLSQKSSDISNSLASTASTKRKCSSFITPTTSANVGVPRQHTSSQSSTSDTENNKTYDISEAVVEVEEPSAAVVSKTSLTQRLEQWNNLHSELKNRVRQMNTVRGNVMSIQPITKTARKEVHNIVDEDNIDAADDENFTPFNTHLDTSLDSREINTSPCELSTNPKASSDKECSVQGEISEAADDIDNQGFNSTEEISQFLIHGVQIERSKLSCSSSNHQCISYGEEIPHEMELQ